MHVWILGNDIPLESLDQFLIVSVSIELFFALFVVRLATAADATAAAAATAAAPAAATTTAAAAPAGDAGEILKSLVPSVFKTVNVSVNSDFWDWHGVTPGQPRATPASPRAG